MLYLLFLRVLAPRAFQLVNLLGLTFILVSIFAIASGMVAHDRQHQTQHFERVKGTR